MQKARHGQNSAAAAAAGGGGGGGGGDAAVADDDDDDDHDDDGGGGDDDDDDHDDALARSSDTCKCCNIRAACHPALEHSAIDAANDVLIVLIGNPVSNVVARCCK